MLDENYHDTVLSQDLCLKQNIWEVENQRMKEEK